VVIPCIAPEILRGYISISIYKAADIYSFGIIINEYLSKEILFNDIPH
jgi:serine/threonine protein kinase